jgi:DnaK suppressor protein
MKKTKKPIKKAAAKTAKKAVKTVGNTGKAKASVKNIARYFPQKELEEIKLKLGEMRENLSKNVEDKKNLDMLEPEVGDSIDQASQSLDKEILFELSDNERKTLDNIDAALRKMDNGVYGFCEHCKNQIEKKRLKALPSARYCLPCQSGAEKSRL